MTQDIFNNFGPNWKWASLSGQGYARLHTVRPNITPKGGLDYDRSKANCTRCDAYDQVGMPADADAVIWERADFSNGPTYETDAFGDPLHEHTAELPIYKHKDWCSEKCAGGVCDCQRMEVPAPLSPCCAAGCVFERKRDSSFCAVHQAPQAEAPSEAPDTVAVMDHGCITQYGSHTFVWYDEAAQVAGAATTLNEAIRQQQAYSDLLNLSAVPEVIDAIAALDKAKAHARHLLNCQESDNHTASLTHVQFIAIFGELPH